MKRFTYPQRPVIQLPFFLLAFFSLLFSVSNVKAFFMRDLFQPAPGGSLAAIAFRDTLPRNQDIDTAAYSEKMKQLANHDRSGKWPPVTALPGKGAILPYQRIVAFYGNFYSAGMGILGEYSAPVMIRKLKQQVKEWELADSSTAVMPALHYIAVTAQSSPGDGTYRLRMPDAEIRKAIALADSVKGIVFLDLQVGLSSLQKELPRLEKFLKLPTVHLGIDPEFSMKSGNKPGTSIGAFDAADINYAMSWLANIVKQYQLPPKVLVVHRFTDPMLTNYKNIITRSEVQVVINMDGFGSPTLKKNTYRYSIYRQPVQFTGFKVFYKNDLNKGGRIMQPSEILALRPRPVYIQYQ